MAQHLQRLSRKDPTTKVTRVLDYSIEYLLSFFLIVICLFEQIKALTSLSELVKQKKGKELVPLIPQWVCFFVNVLMLCIVLILVFPHVAVHVVVL